jgi:hypothetical protein
MPGPESAHDLIERTQRADLAVPEVSLKAERSDEIPGTGQVGAGHRREQMVLNLIVEPPGGRRSCTCHRQRYGL